MYSFAPINAIDSLNDHGGFFFMCYVCIILFLVCIYNIENKKEFAKGITFILFILSISAYFSWNTSDIQTFRNEKVIATFVNYQPEGYTITEQSGKTTIQVDHHLMFVVYNISGKGNIILPANYGQIYPEKVILYKN